MVHPQTNKDIAMFKKMAKGVAEDLGDAAQEAAQDAAKDALNDAIDDVLSSHESDDEAKLTMKRAMRQRKADAELAQQTNEAMSLAATPAAPETQAAAPDLRAAVAEETKSAGVGLAKMVAA